jgi:5'-methylthioadenosine phosphorylase
MDKIINLAIIGGSGLYAMNGLHDCQEVMPDTPFGKPSAPIITGTIDDQKVAFLARHGIGHVLSPSAVPYRANIYALKQLGVERIVSISACGSLRDDFAPGDIVVPNQLMDYTRRRIPTFFEDGIVAHVSVADPFCPDLSRQVTEAVRSAGGTVHGSGALVTIEGPRFSTRAESNTFRTLGMSIINMSTAPEAFLAREAEMCYSVMNHVTDYDVWHISEKPVSVEMVIEILNRNTDLAQQAVQNLVNNLSLQRVCDCSHALASALITDPKLIPDETLNRLQPLVSKYIHRS